MKIQLIIKDCLQLLDFKLIILDQTFKEKREKIKINNNTIQLSNHL